jgi:TRAP-type C4-dicarboxylate transport system permease small subunit
MKVTRDSRVLALLGGLEFRLVELSLAALVVMNGVGVFARYVLGSAVGELFEIMILLSVATYWLGIATAERLGGHLGMDLPVTMLPQGPRRLAELIRKVIILCFLAVVIYSGVRLSMSQFRFGTNSGILDMPLWIFSAFMPIGCALLAWRTLFPPRVFGHQNGPAA